MGENVNNEAGTSSSTVFQKVVKDSDVFKSLVTLLRNSYLGSVSQNNFQYSQATLVINNSFLEEYKKFLQQKKARGYTGEELKQRYAFLLFDSENKAKLVCETGVRVGSSIMSTLGDPVEGVYISKYSNYLHPRPWYQGKSGYIVIFKLIKGKEKVVPENYTLKYTAPSPGYDCHVSANIGKVTAKTSHFQAFELNQYYVYEFHNSVTVKRPRQICPYAIMAFQYTEPKRTIAILKDKVIIGHKNQVYYSAWKGPLIVQGQLVCDIVLQSLHTSAVPAQLSDKLEVKHIMRVSALKKKLPVGVFEKSNFIKKEAHHQGIYCSLFEVITTNQKEDKLNQLIGKMKEKDLAIIRCLNDQGFLLLITSSVLTSGKEFDVQVPAGLLAVFLFSSSRLLSMQGRKPLVAAEQELDKRTNSKAISVMVSSVLPGLHYSLLEAKKFQGEVETGPSTLVEKNFREFVRLHRTGSLPVCSNRILINLSSDLSADDLAPSETCRKMALPRLRSYIADPSSFALEVSQMTKALQSPAKMPPYPCLIANGSCEAVTPLTPVGSAPAAWVRTEAEKAEAPSGKSQPSQGRKSNNIKETRDELSPRREKSKRKDSTEMLIGAKRRWTSQTLPSAVESIATRKGTRTKKSPFSLFSKKPAQAAAQNTDETTVKLANIQYHTEKKRGAEVLTAEFVQHTKPEISTNGGTSCEDRSSGLSIKKPKETQKPSSKKVSHSNKRITRTMKSQAKGKKQPIVRKQVEPARKATFGSLRKEILSDSRAASVDVNNSTKQSSMTTVKPASERSSKQNKSVMAQATSRSVNSHSKSESTVAQASPTKSDFYNQSSVTLAQDSSSKNDGSKNTLGMVLDLTSVGSEVQEESSGAPRENYESHALNLLADLALSSVTSSTAPSVVRDDGVLPVKSTEHSGSPKEKPVRTLSDHEYHRIDKPRKGGYLASSKSPSAAHRHGLKQNIAFCALEKKGTSLVTLENSLSSAVSPISLEHSYTLPFLDHSKKYDFSKGTQNSSKYKVHNIKAGSAVFGRVMPFRRQQSIAHARLNRKLRRCFSDPDQKTGSPQSRTVQKTNETFKVTCTWEAEYLFDLDSKYTTDPLEKTVNRALHGPWDPDLPDNVEEVKLILHTWVALFYNKPSKALSSASRKVVEHINPAKFVSINSTLDPCELLEEDNRSPNSTEACADSPSEATDNSCRTNNRILPFSCSPLFCSKSATQDFLQTGKKEDSINMFLKKRKGQHTVSSDACSNIVSDYPDKVNGHEIEQEEASLSVEESCKNVSSSNECADGSSTPRVLPSSESSSVPNTADMSFNETSQNNRCTSQPEFSEDVTIEEHVIDDIIFVSENDSTTNEVTVSLKDNEEGCRSGGNRERLRDCEEHQTEGEIVHQEQIASNESIVCKEDGSNLDDKNLALEHISDVHTQEVVILEQNKLDANKSLHPNDLSQAALSSACHNNQEASHKVLQTLTELGKQQELSDIMHFENMKSVQIDTMHNKSTETSLEDSRYSSVDQISKTNQVHDTTIAQEPGNSVTALTNEYSTASEHDTLGPRNSNITNSVSNKSFLCSEGVNTVEETLVCAGEKNESRAEKSGNSNASLSKFAESPYVSPVHAREALAKVDSTQNNFLGSRLDCTPMENEDVCSKKDESLCISDQTLQISEGEQRSSFSDVSELHLVSLEKLENDFLLNKTRTSDQKNKMDGKQTNMDSDKKETSFQDISSHGDDKIHNESDTIDQEHEIALVETIELLKNDIKSVSIPSNKPINCESANFRNSICISEGEETNHICDEIHEELAEESPVNTEDIVPMNSKFMSEEAGKTKQKSCENVIPEAMEAESSETTGGEFTVNMRGITLMNSVCAPKDTQQKSSVCKMEELQSEQLLTEKPEINLGNVSPLSSVCASEREQNTVDVCHESSICKMVELQSEQQLTEEPTISLGNITPVSYVCASENEQKTVEVCHESSACKLTELQSDQLLERESTVSLANVSPVSSVCASEGELKTVEVCHESSVCKMTELQSDQLLEEESTVSLANVSPVSSVCASEGELKTVEVCHESSVCKMTELQSDQLLEEESTVSLANVSPVSSVCASEGELKTVEVCHESSVCKMTELQSDQLLEEECTVSLANVSPVSSVCASEGELKTVEVCHESSVCKMTELQSDQLLEEECTVSLANVSPVSSVCASEGELKTVEVCHESSLCKMTELQSDQLLEEECTVSLANVSPVSSVCASEGELKTVEVCHESSVCKMTELQSDQLLEEESTVSLANVSPVSSVCASEGELQTVEVCHESSVCKMTELQSDQLLEEESTVSLANVSPVSSVCASEGELKTVEVCHESSVCKMTELQSDQLLEEESTVSLANVSPVSSVCASEGELKTVEVCLESSVCKMTELQSDHLLEEESTVSPVSSVCASEGELKTVEVCHESSVCKMAELQSDQLLEEPTISLGCFSPVSSVCASEIEQKTEDAHLMSSVRELAELQSDQLLAEKSAVSLGGFSLVSSRCVSEGEERPVNTCHKSSVCKVVDLKSNKEKAEELSGVACTESPDEGLHSPLVQKSSKSPVYESCEELLEASDTENVSADDTFSKCLGEEPWANYFHKQRNSDQEPNGGSAKPSTAKLYDSFVSKIRDTARKSLRRPTSRYPEYEHGKNSYDWDYATMNKRLQLFNSVSKYRDCRTVSEEEAECPPLQNHITNHYENPKSFTIKGHQREPSRTLHSFQEDNNFTERPNQIRVRDRTWMVTDLTQNTLDLEYLRFIHKLKQVLKSLAPPISTHVNGLLTNSGQATVKTLALRQGPERQSSARANNSRTPLLVTIRRLDAGQSGWCQQPQCKVKCSFTEPPFCVRFQDKVAGGTKASKSRNQTSKLMTSSFHTNEFNYEKKLREPSAPSRPVRHAKMSGVISGGTAKGWCNNMEEDTGSSEEIQDLLPQGTTSYKSMITDLCSSLCFKLSSVAKDASKKPFMFCILETSNDPSFRRMKNLLKREGHKEMEVLPFCQAEHLEEDKLIVIIKNEDISSHIHEIPHLLRLKLLPNVFFAGVDGPEDVVNYTYQGLFHSGGFVVSEETLLETVTIGQLKEVVKVLEKLNENGRWKWFIHYKEDKKLKEDRRVNLITQKKSLILKSCQQANIVEVLHYHLCDSRSSKKSEELKCLLNLQIQHIGARLALYLTDKPSTTREVFEKNGILVTDIDTFLGTVQRLAAPFRTTYW
ncbi:protein TASOR 2 [Microcaecilia unicolor]|uniref:Protein FAM208B n=1 Tax=Microcaecilia unicolor TaxID=1415580 RepID=A0A6P7Z7S3_9AMPH|nr:protein FAM208B [Microcaecilia unicolor]